MKSTIFFTVLSVTKAKLEFAIVVLCSLLALLSTAGMLYSVSESEKIKSIFLEHFLLDLGWKWIALVVLFFFSQELFRYTARRNILKLSIKTEMGMYKSLKNKLEYAVEPALIATAMKSDVPCVMRGVRSLLNCITPLMILCVILIYFQGIFPRVTYVLVGALLIFVFVQYFLSSPGENIGKKFNEINRKRSLTFSNLVNEKKVAEFEETIDDYSHAFLRRMLSIENNNFLTSLLMFLVISGFSISFLNFETLTNTKSNEVGLIIVSLFVFITQLSNIASSLASYMILKQHFEELYKNYNE